MSNAVRLRQAGFAAEARSANRWSLSLPGSVSRPEALALLGLLLLGAFVAGWGLGSKPISNEEATSVELAMRSLRRLLHEVLTHEPGLALYHLFLWAWKGLGTSEAVLRLPSLVFALAAIPPTVLVARRVLALRWALLSGVF